MNAHVRPHITSPLAWLIVGTACTVSPGTTAERDVDGSGTNIPVAPSFDCAEASSEIQQLVCDSPELAMLDRRLDSVYARSVEIAETFPNAGDLAYLRADQRGWISGRDACWLEEDRTECARREYIDRVALLQARFSLLEPTSTAFWACEANAANEFVTTFYPTDPPSARIERGDQTDIGLLTPTASGTRYEASFGRVFWARGDEATADWPQGTSWSCALRERR